MAPIVRLCPEGMWGVEDIIEGDVSEGSGQLKAGVLL